MKYKSSVIEVKIRLDPVPGWGHQPEDHVALLKSQIPKWYLPEVTLIRVEDEPDLTGEGKE